MFLRDMMFKRTRSSSLQEAYLKFTFNGYYLGLLLFGRERWLRNIARSQQINEVGPSPRQTIRRGCFLAK